MGYAIKRPDTAFSLSPSKGKRRPRQEDDAPARNNWTDRLFEARDGTIELSCRGCGISIYIPPSQIKQRAYCSLECKASHPRPKIGGWVDRIWEKRAGTIEKTCIGCYRAMHIPPSKMERAFCSIECKKAKTKSDLTKDCEICARTFVAWTREQRYCSQKCNGASGHLSSPENLAAAVAGRQKAIAEGRITFSSGPENPQWMGGPAGLRKRQIASGKAAEWTRRYRKANPDKVAEFSKRRSGRKIGRLAYGTIPRIRKAQKNLCAFCRTSLDAGCHMDHITPLARGGKHIASNIQLLCGPCNLAKSSRDPIVHMQSLGRLL